MSVVICNTLQGALLGLPSCKSDSWRRYTCADVLLVYKEEVDELVQPGGCEDCLEGLLGRNYVWCLVIVVIFLRLGQAGTKRCGNT